MRALTLTQPWAGLVVSGIKLVENRPRKMISPRDFGQPFAIHASREISKDATRQIIEIAPELMTLPDPPLPWIRLAFITSAIIGVATIDRVLDPVACGLDPGSEDARAPLAIDQRRWFFGPIGYVLRDVRALKTPIAIKGQLGFWTLPDDVAAQVEAQLAEAT